MYNYFYLGCCNGMAFSMSVVSNTTFVQKILQEGNSIAKLIFQYLPWPSYLGG